MELIDGAPAVRLSTMSSHGGTSVTRFGGPSAMDLASDGGHLTTTFGGPPAVDFVGGYPTTAAGGLPSAMGRTSGASTTDAVIGHPTPTISGFAPVTSFGDGHRVMNAGASPSAPGLAGK